MPKIFSKTFCSTLALGCACLGLLCAVATPSRAAQATPDAYLDVPYRFYRDETIIELPAILGAENITIQYINAEIQRVGQDYALFTSLRPADSYDWCELVAYPASSGRYLNILLTAVVYPNYGTDGDLYGWVYDKDNGDLVGLDRAMAMAGVDFAKLEADLRLAEPQMLLRNILYLTFVIKPDDKVDFYFNALFDNPEADPRQGFYRWSDGRAERVQGGLLAPDAIDSLPGGPLAAQRGE